MVRQYDIAQVVDALPDIANGDLLGVQGEFEFVANKILERLDESFQIFFVGGNYHKVVGVARVMFDLQIVLNELVEFVHVNVGKQLRSKIADWQAVTIKESRLSGRKASDNLLHKPHGVRIDYSLLENCQKNFVINRIEKLPHVALEREARPRIILTLSTDHAFGGQHPLVCTLIDSARKRIGDKGLLKNRIENSENRMVQNPIAHRGLVNVAHFRIADIETLIRPVGVTFGEQVSV